MARRRLLVSRATATGDHHPRQKPAQPGKLLRKHHLLPEELCGQSRTPDKRLKSSSASTSPALVALRRRLQSATGSTVAAARARRRPARRWQEVQREHYFRPAGRPLWQTCAAHLFIAFSAPALNSPPARSTRWSSDEYQVAFDTPRLRSLWIDSCPTRSCWRWSRSEPFGREVNRASRGKPFFGARGMDFVF